MILVLNLGSGTIKGAAFDFGGSGSDLARVWELDVVRHTDPQQVTVTAGGQVVEFDVRSSDMTALAPAIKALWAGPTAVVDDPSAITAVGHRIVHGANATGPRRLTHEDRQLIEQVSSFAPLHNPPALELVDVAAESLPGATHVAVFDTSFHTTMPAEAVAYGGPRNWIDRGLRRYGFHGISHADAAQRAADALNESIETLQLVTVHLGGGCSATAIRHGRSVDTTMGMTPTDGLVMATRSGGVDPGLLIYLLREDGLSVDELEHLLNHESGLMGLTGGVTGDIGEVHRRSLDGDDSARLTEQVYVRAIIGQIARLRTSLDRLDAVVFTGSAAEDHRWLRERIAAGLGHLGVEIDPGRNARGDVDVATDTYPARILCIESDEALAIARSVAEVLGHELRG